MSHFGSDITEQFLNKLYEDLSKEQMRLMNDLKECGGTEQPKGKEQDIQRQLTMLNSLMITSLRFRNLRKDIQKKANSI
jgi:hypothetical protein